MNEAGTGSVSEGGAILRGTLEMTEPGTMAATTATAVTADTAPGARRPDPRRDGTTAVPVEPCAGCEERAATVGRLCAGCAGRIACKREVCMEQIESGVPRQARAALIDLWGRPHPVGDGTLIGRRAPADGVRIREGSVSGIHAEIARDSGGGWRVVDRGSTNGTFADGERVVESARLRHGSLLQVSRFGFYFVALEPGAPLPAHAGPLEAGEQTHEYRIVSFERGAGGGVVQFERRSAILPPLEFALLERLARQRRTDGSGPLAGFVPVEHLRADLPWNNAQPSDDQVRAAVRRLKKRFARHELGAIVESRRGFGYRLAVEPGVLVVESGERGEDGGSDVR
jgi:hypothetical protein